MNKQFDFKSFMTHADLIAFVNENNIQKEDIQQIITVQHTDYYLTLWYWHYGIGTNQ